MAKSLLEQFQSYLLVNSFSAGDKLETELELAARFQVSRGTMREILIHLCHMGILERVKNKGTFIKKITPEKLENDIAFCFQLLGFCFEDLKEARLCIETSLIPIVVRRITPSQLERLRKNIVEMESLVEEPEKADCVDRDFHLKLLEACNNSALKMFSNVIYLLFRKKFRTKFLNPDAVRKSIRDHQTILNAIAKDDADQATKILTEHILPTYRTPNN